MVNGGIATFDPGDIDHQVSPATSSGDTAVAIYGAIWSWTSQDTARPGAWISGPGVKIGQIFPGKARSPAWDPHNNLIFFALSDKGGYDHYLITFNSHNTDLAKVDHLDADVNLVVWLGRR